MRPAVSATPSPQRERSSGVFPFFWRFLSAFFVFLLSFCTSSCGQQKEPLARAVLTVCRPLTPGRRVGLSRGGRRGREGARREGERDEGRERRRGARREGEGVGGEGGSLNYLPGCGLILRLGFLPSTTLKAPKVPRRREEERLPLLLSASPSPLLAPYIHPRNQLRFARRGKHTP